MEKCQDDEPGLSGMHEADCACVCGRAPFRGGGGGAGWMGLGGGGSSPPSGAEILEVPKAPQQTFGQKLKKRKLLIGRRQRTLQRVLEH